MAVSKRIERPLAIFPAFDSSIESIDDYRARRRVFLAEQERQWKADSPMAQARDAEGRLLYRMTPSGNLTRTQPMSDRLKNAVKERDGFACVWCGSPENLEVDHIVRYVDGGGNGMDNLRTLCADCHSTRGGHA